MQTIDEMLRTAQPKSEWVCTPCRYPDCDQRFVTEHAKTSHQQRSHAGERVRVEA